MDDEFVLIAPDAHRVINLSRRMLSQTELNCMSLQDKFAVKEDVALSEQDIIFVVAILFAGLVVIDRVYAYVKTRMQAKSQVGIRENIVQTFFLKINIQKNLRKDAHNLGITITNLAAQATWPSAILEGAVAVAEVCFLGCIAS